MKEPIVSNGTYVAVRVHPDSARLIKNFCKLHRIPIGSSDFERRLHSTIIYSRKECPDLEADPNYEVTATFDGYALFNAGGPDGPLTVLVAKLFCPDLEVRHRYLMAAHQATFDFPSFRPHITLSYTFNGDIDDLPPIEFPIMLGNEYAEELEL
jgi:hypothetical protein